MYTLYGTPGTCSLALHVVLNEIGCQFQWKNVSAESAPEARESFLKLNPLGAVPVLQDGALTLTEGAAILLYLCEKHNSPLLPKEEAARAKALEWLMFANATVHPAYGRGFFLKKMCSNNESCKPLIEATVERINTLWGLVEKQLEKTPYCAGQTLTCADILLTVIANWSRNIPGTIVFSPQTKALFQKVCTLPCFTKALAQEEVSYSAVG
jgi:glutathione S-transferase